MKEQMPTFHAEPTIEKKWSRHLLATNENDRVWNEDRVHVSDLVSCLRRPVLSREYESDWSDTTLWMFGLGRAFEETLRQHIFGSLIPESTQELEVHEEGIVGHIDFATEDELDYECKFTWKREPQDEESIAELFDRSQYWVMQAGAYAIMRRRAVSRFAVLHISSIPNPKLRVYRLEWTSEEQAKLWSQLQSTRQYLIDKQRAGELPMKTLDTKLCRTCQVKEVCDVFSG